MRSAGEMKMQVVVDLLFVLSVELFTNAWYDFKYKTPFSLSLLYQEDSAASHITYK